MRLLSLTTAFLLITTWVNAQSLLMHEKKIYAAPDGKMYIQKSLPIYLRLATSPDDGSKTYLLKSEVTKQYSNPMYLDTEGYNTVRSPSAVDTVTKHPVFPQQDIIFEVYADSKPPVTTFDFSGAKLFDKAGKLYCKGGVDVSLTAKDEGAGVDKIYFSVNGGPFQEYKAPMNFKEEKEFNIAYYSVDNVGNAGDVKVENFLIDLTSPLSEFEITGPWYENILSYRSSIILKATDQSSGVSAIRYKIDESPVKTYTSAIKMKDIPQGEHVIVYFSEDNVNNSEPEKKYTFYIDNTPPILIQELIGNTIDINGAEFTSGRTKLKLTAKDNKAGVKAVYYSINGSEYKFYNEPFYLSENSGKLLIKTNAIDYVDNKSNWSEIDERTNIPYIDLTGPSLSYRLKGTFFKFKDTIYISQGAMIELMGKDLEAGLNRIEYTIDNKEPHKFDAPFTIQEEGFHQLTFQGFDNVENSNLSSIKFVIDNTGPEVSHQFSTLPVQTLEGESVSSIYPPYVVVFFSATDVSVGFDKMLYSINGSPETVYSGLLGNFIRGKDYTLKVRALDKLGNQTLQEVKFMIGN